MVADAPDAVLPALVGWGLRVVHPDAAHPVLERIGAQAVTAAELAVHPVLRDRVLDGDPAAAPVLLALVEAAGASAGPSWWGEVLLPDHDDEPAPARGLVVPGSAAARWFDPEVLAPVRADLAARWGQTLVAVGVRAGLVVEQVDDLLADVLEDWPEYLASTGVPDDGSLLAVADLDAVQDWPGVLAALAAEPDVLAPVRDQDGAPAPSYTVWRLRDEPALGGGRPFALPGADRSAGVMADLDPPPRGARRRAADPAACARRGSDAEGLTDRDWAVLLDELEPGDQVALSLAVDCWRALAARTDRPGPLVDAAVLPGWDGSRALAVPADDLAVADPMWRRHPGVWPVVPAPWGAAEDLAEALDLDLASDRAAGRVTSAGAGVELPAVLDGVLPGLPRSWVRHDRLEVDGAPLDWWLADGFLHATATGLADGLAALVGGHRAVIGGLLSGRLDRSDALLALVDGSTTG